MRTTFRVSLHDNDQCKPVCLVVFMGDVRVEIWASSEEISDLSRMTADIGTRHLKGLTSKRQDEAAGSSYAPMFGDGEPI